MSSNLKKAGLIGALVAVIAGVVYAIFRIKRKKAQDSTDI